MSEGAVDLKELGRSLSTLLRTIVRVLPSNWQGEHMQTSNRNKQRSHTYTDNFKNSDFPTEQNGLPAGSLFLKLDNTKCKRQCFRKASRAAQYLAMALHNNWDPGIPISGVGGTYKLLCLILSYNIYQRA